MNKKENILHFNGLYGDDYGNYSSEYIFLEQIATRSKTFDWTIKPHVHAHLFQVFFVMKGSLEFTNVHTKSFIQSPCILLIPPTFLHGLIYSPNTEGYILSLSDSVVNDIFKTSPSFLHACDRIHVIDKFKSNQTFEAIIDNLKIIESELFGEQIERMLMLNALLSALFISLYRLCDVDLDHQSDSSMASYFRKFIHLVKSTSQDKDIPYFAEELHISTVHLNRICKQMAGKPASAIITDHIILEAQKYLLHTSYSISEISYLLHFEYPNYFARKFKKQVGLSPQEFRRLDRK